MQQAQEIRSILFEILEQAFQAPDVSATQQLGVQLSNAVKREGVVIIQNQNVEVYAKIMPSMVRALRLCDSFEPAVAVAYEPLQITENTDTEADPVHAYCEAMFKRGTKWEELIALTKAAYIEYTTSRFNTKREAAEFLGIGPTYLSKITKDQKGEA